MSEQSSTVDMMNGALEFTIPIAHKMGVRVVEARPGFAATTAPMEGNGNHFGVMYAGVLFTVAEVLGGILALVAFDQSKFYPLVKDLKIDFLKPGKTDVRAEAALSDAEIARIAAEAAEKGKAEYELTATVTGTDGVVVARTVGLYQLRSKDR